MFRPDSGDGGHRLRLCVLRPEIQDTFQVMIIPAGEEASILTTNYIASDTMSVHI